MKQYDQPASALKSWTITYYTRTRSTNAANSSSVNIG